MIKILKEEERSILFETDNLTTEEVNGLRRIIKTKIPNRSMKITKLLNIEISTVYEEIEQNLSFIPLKIYDDYEKFTFSLKKKNKDKNNIKELSTDDIKWFYNFEPYTKEVFPEKYYFYQLNPSDSIHLEGIIEEGIGKIHKRFDSVYGVKYKLLENKNYVLGFSTNGADTAKNTLKKALEILVSIFEKIQKIISKGDEKIIQIETINENDIKIRFLEESFEIHSIVASQIKQLYKDKYFVGSNSVFYDKEDAFIRLNSSDNTNIETAIEESRKKFHNILKHIN